MIQFTGDINLTDNAFDVGFGVGSSISKGYFRPFENFLKHEDDIWVGNFEGVVADVTNKDGIYSNVFRLDTNDFKNTLSIIDYWGGANNHVMEHGEEAYRQMVNYLSESSKGIFGSNKQRSIQFEHNGAKVGITGFSMRVEEKSKNPLYWHLPELIELQNEAINIADADYKIAYIHWGVEYVDHPYVEQVKFAHWLIDIGYDLVIGMHPHVLQGYEVYKEKYIFYSIGNTVFNMNHKPSRYGAIVNLDVLTGKVGYNYIHINDVYSPEMIDEKEVPVQYRFSTLNPKIENEKNIEKYIGEFHKGLNSFRKSNYKDFVGNIYRFRPGVFKQIIKDFIKRRL